MTERYTITSSYAGMMPNQVEGYVDGKPFYFRARWGAWSLQVNDDPQGDGVDGRCVAQGLDETAGWWEEDDVFAFCRSQLDAYLAPAAPRG